METLFLFVGEHWLLSGLFIILLATIFIFELVTKSQSSPQITPQEAVQLINREDAIVVDIRNQDAFKQGHIINSFHIPFQTLQKDVEKLSEHKHKPIILVCAQGAQAGKVAQMINQNEYEQVAILQGGIKAWREASLPLEKGKK